MKLTAFFFQNTETNICWHKDNSHHKEGNCIFCYLSIFQKYPDHCWCNFLVKPLSFCKLFVNWLFFSKHYVSYRSSFIKHFFVCRFNNRKFAFKTDRIKIKINWAFFFFLCIQQCFSGKSTKTVMGNKILSDNKW